MKTIKVFDGILVHRAGPVAWIHLNQWVGLNVKGLEHIPTISWELRSKGEANIRRLSPRRRPTSTQYCSNCAESSTRRRRTLCSGSPQSHANPPGSARALVETGANRPRLSRPTKSAILKALLSVRGTRCPVTR
jgi:hypothetical protein